MSPTNSLDQYRKPTLPMKMRMLQSPTPSVPAYLTFPLVVPSTHVLLSTSHCWTHCWVTAKHAVISNLKDTWERSMRLEEWKPCWLMQSSIHLWIFFNTVSWLTCFGIECQKAGLRDSSSRFAAVVRWWLKLHRAEQKSVGTCYLGLTVWYFHVAERGHPQKMEALQAQNMHCLH